MSRENVERYLDCVDAFNQRDLERFLSYADPEVDVASRLATFEGGYQGHAGTRQWWRDLLGFAPDYRLEVAETRDLGEVTIARINATGSGSTSGAPIAGTIWHACRWREGKCVWWSVFPTEQEALEAAGLSE